MKKIRRHSTLYLDRGDVPRHPDPVGVGGVDPSRLKPQRLVRVGVFAKDLLEDLPGEVVDPLQTKSTGTDVNRVAAV
jgi:hypothetical protein